ncbi:MAG: hypothetical protein SynsKO_41700 [Synoicihabitans sp.]
MAGSTSENHFDGLVTQTSSSTNFRTSKLDYRTRQNGTIRKIEFMSRRVYRIIFNGRGDIEARLFESETHTSNPGE